MLHSGGDRVAAANTRRRLTKDSVGELLSGPRAPKFRYDHHADNLRKLAELQQQAALRREDAAAPPPEPFKMSRFAHVESRLAQAGLGRSPPKEPRRNSGSASGECPDGSGGADADGDVENSRPSRSAGEGAASKHGGFLRRKQFADPTAELPRPFVRPRLISAEAAPLERKPQLPRASELQQRAQPPPPREDRDFLGANARAAMQPQQRAAAVDPSQPLPRRADYGALPDYLRERKDGWAAEAAAKRQAALEAEGCPKGHKLMPDAERVETLELLKASLGEARDVLQRMPLRVEIPSAVRKKAELEAKVAKLEDAMKVLGKPRVYVKL